MGFFNKLFGKEKKAELPEELAALFGKIAAQQNLFDKQRDEYRAKTKTNVAGSSSPDYGFCKENPVFVNGFLGNDVYIKSLVTDSGETITWARIGTDKCDNVPGITDIYEGTLKDGQVYAIIFVNLYGTSNPSTAPKGLRIDRSGRSSIRHL